jgi:hypothetical protein
MEHDNNADGAGRDVAGEADASVPPPPPVDWQTWDRASFAAQPMAAAVPSHRRLPRPRHSRRVLGLASVTAVVSAAVLLGSLSDPVRPKPPTGGLSSPLAAEPSASAAAGSPAPVSRKVAAPAAPAATPTASPSRAGTASPSGKVREAAEQAGGGRGVDAAPRSEVPVRSVQARRPVGGGRESRATPGRNRDVGASGHRQGRDRRASGGRSRPPASRDGSPSRPGRPGQHPRPREQGPSLSGPGDPFSAREVCRRFEGEWRHSYCLQMWPRYRRQLGL